MNREVIIACDFNNKEEFFKFLSNFDEKLFLKIGMELFYNEGPSIVEYAKCLGHKIFLDLKLHDIPNTVYKSLLNIKALDVDFVTVHATGGREMLKSVSSALEGSNTKALAVTVLTSIDQDTLTNELNVNMNLKDHVVSLAKLAKQCNIEGLVCSPHEVEAIKESVDIICVTPGIRLVESNTQDQKRVATPKHAYEIGSDYIVVGRSITESADVVSAYRECVNQFGGNHE